MTTTDVCEYTLSTRTSRRVQWTFGIIRFAYTAATTVTVVVVVTVASAVMIVSPIVDRSVIAASYKIASIRSVPRVIYNTKYTTNAPGKTHSHVRTTGPR